MMRLTRPVPLTRRPTVSVVIPCYQYGHFLPGAVASVTDQVDVEVDVLIVDDASPDGSGDIAHDIARQDDRVRVLRHEVNLGHLRTYNDGLAAVEGEYVVLLSADDLLAPGALARAVALLESHPNVGFTYGYARTFENLVPKCNSHVRSWSVWQGEDWFAHLCRTGRNLVVSPEVVMRRSVLKAAGGGYDLCLPHSADMYLWLRAAQVSDVGRVNGPDQAYYRVHGANMHLNQFAGVLTDMRERLKTWDQVFAHSDVRIELPRLHRLALRGLAFQAVDFASEACDEGDWDPAQVAEIASFAQEAWPGVTRTVKWKMLSYRMHRAEPTRYMRMSNRARDLRYKARWRRWRRYGV